MRVKILSIILCALLLLPSVMGCNQSSVPPVTDTESDTISQIITDELISDVLTSDGQNSPLAPDPEVPPVEESTTTGGDDSTLVPDPEVPTPTPTPDPTPEPETPAPNIEFVLAKNGTSEYTIVYDDNDPIISQLTLEFASKMENKYGIIIPVKKNSEATSTSKEILIGNIRNTVRRILLQLKSAGDFHIGISGQRLVLVATNSKMYHYLFDILEKDFLSAIENGNWSAWTNDTLIYSKSDYKDTPYPKYLMGEETTISDTVLEKILEKHVFEATDGTKLTYRLYMPYDYDSTREYPVLTFLHGAGERGNDGSKHLCHVIKDLFNQDNEELYKTIILIPQCPEGQQWVDTPWAEGNYHVSIVPESNENKAVMEILDYLDQAYSINQSRLYLAGISMGGFGVWDLMMRHDERFAAMLAICGGADTIRAERLKNKPIYAVHCYNDNTVPYEGTKEMVDAIRSRGGTSIIFETPDKEGKGYGGHTGAWYYASREPQILNWLLSQTL